MKKNNLIRFVQSLVLLPLATTMMSSGVPAEKAPNVFAKVNIEALSALSFNQDHGDLALIQKAKARAIDAYFEERSMPLAGTGAKMVQEADKNGLDWRLLAAISVRESTGGKHACKKASYSAFGWGSCKINFESYDHSIEVVAKNLGGNNPNTAYHYADKDTKAILQAYNPPSIVPRYADQVMKIMNTIGPVDLGLNDSLAQS